MNLLIQMLIRILKPQFPETSSIFSIGFFTKLYKKTVFSRKANQQI
jgi:hypothetical protein